MVYKQRSCGINSARSGRNLLRLSLANRSPEAMRNRFVLITFGAAIPLRARVTLVRGRKRWLKDARGSRIMFLTRFARTGDLICGQGKSCLMSVE